MCMSWNRFISHQTVDATTHPHFVYRFFFYILLLFTLSKSQISSLLCLQCARKAHKKQRTENNLILCNREKFSGFSFDRNKKSACICAESAESAVVSEICAAEKKIEAIHSWVYRTVTFGKCLVCWCDRCLARWVCRGLAVYRWMWIYWMKSSLYRLL